MTMEVFSLRSYLLDLAIPPRDTPSLQSGDSSDLIADCAAASTLAAASSRVAAAAIRR